MKRQLLNQAGIIAAISLTVLSLISCQKQDEMSQNPANQINLTADVATKGAIATTSNIAEFTAFGYTQGRNDWADVLSTATANLMFNNKYTKVGDSWVGQTQTAWPDNEFKRYSFFAYSPSASVANKITLLTTPSSVGYQKLSYQTLADVPSQVDLVLAERLNQTPANTVPMTFNHALSRVGFCAYAQLPGVTIKSISINGIKYKGDIEVRRGATWSNVSADKTNFTAAINSSNISTDANNPTMLTGANGENYFMILPQDLSANSDVATNITVVTSKEGRDRSLTFTIKNNYEQGKSVLYKLFVADIIDISYSYTVNDWTTTNIPTTINATYLNLSPLSSFLPAVIHYSTDYKGGFSYKNNTSFGMLSFSTDTLKKTITINSNDLGIYKATITVGTISVVVDLYHLLVVAPATQANLPYTENKVTVKISSLFPWSVSSSLSGVVFEPSSGGAVVNQTVNITVPLNLTRSARNITATFTTTNGTISRSLDWVGSQAANPNYHLGRFAGTIVTRQIDANTTRYYYNKQLFTSPDDEKSFYEWAGDNTNTGATSWFDGKRNTEILVALGSDAAYNCNNKAGGGWYLPAANQLYSLWMARMYIGTFKNVSYWSSTESGMYKVAVVDLTDGRTFAYGKQSLFTMRCVREEYDNR